MSEELLAGYQDEDEPIPAGAAQIHSSSRPDGRSLLGLAVAVVTVAALYLARNVLLPITLAVLLSFILSPLVNFLQHRRLWRGPAVGLTVLAALGVIALIGTLIGTQAASLATDAPRYAQTISAKVQSVQEVAATRMAAITRAMSGRKPVARQTAGPQRMATPVATDSDDDRQGVLVRIASPPVSSAAVVQAIVAPVLGPLETTAIVLIVAIFILMQKEDLRDRFIRLFGSSDLHRTTVALDDAAHRLSRYLLSQLAVNAGFGLVIGIGLWLIGIPSPALWGILGGLLRFVPYIGTFLAAAAPLALGAAIDPGWSTAIYVAVLFAVVEPVTGYGLEPLVYGHSTGLSPISVIVSAIFWAWIWGPVGLIISTPLSLCLVVAGRHVKSLEFFDILLGDRPALSSVDSLYQRLLADHPDEALAHAEALLADRALIDYYDDVVLEALKLAALDDARRPADHNRTRALARSIGGIIKELDEHAARLTDQEAANLGNAGRAIIGRVACIPGTGPFDTVVAAMLAQLIRQRGGTARIISQAKVSRESIAEIDLTGLQVICLCYLDLTGTPAQLRYLVRRLRRQAADARIVVGIWRKDDAALINADIHNAVGADGFAGSLRQMTELSGGGGTDRHQSKHSNETGSPA